MAGSGKLVAEPNADNLDLFLMQVVLIILLTRIISKLLKRLQQPSVIAEIIAGILLGPTCLGYIPGFSEYMFPQRSLGILKVFADVGLILFMFFLGLEVDPGAMVNTWRTSVPLALAGLILPWISGGLLSFWLYPLEQVKATKIVFFLFTGTAFSFTAMPVLGRILAARKLITTPLGIEALAIAAVDDLLAWTTLAIVLAYANGGTPINGLYTILISIAFILFLLFPVRKLNHWINNRLVARGKLESRNFTAFILLSLCIASWFANLIGIHAFFGAFVYGIMVPRGHFLEFMAPKIELLVVEFFLPLYFANSGIRTQLGALDGPAWGITVVVVIVASLSKILPATIGTYYLTGKKADWRHCLSVGVLINTRGLVALIVLNIGLSAGIFGEKVFSLMVVMALVTTFATSPSIYFLNRNRPHVQPQIDGDHNINNNKELDNPRSSGDIHGDVDKAHENSGGTSSEGQRSRSSIRANTLAELIIPSDDTYDRGLSMRHLRTQSQQPAGGGPGSPRAAAPADLENVPEETGR